MICSFLSLCNDPGNSKSFLHTARGNKEQRILKLDMFEFKNRRICCILIAFFLFSFKVFILFLCACVCACNQVQVNLGV